MPLYLLDANVLISAHREYYPHHRVPQFWEWLAHICAEGKAKIPLECYEEITDGKDDWLAEWAKANRKALVLEEDSDPQVVAHVTEKGYAPDLTDDEIETIGRDPFLVAHALNKDRCVVTTEVSKPGKQRQNRKLPDVCNDFGVKWSHTFPVLDALGFSTGWEPPKK